MWYTLGYANTFICTPAHGGRAGNLGDRSPVRVRLYRTPLPNPPRQCRGPVDHDDGARPALTDQTVRNALHAFHQRGLAALQPQSSRPHTCATIFTPGVCESLRALLHQSPRTFGKPTSRWTLALAAEVSFAQGLTPRLVSDEAIRVALRRLRVSWKRAKHWITSPDPAYARKKNGATG
jgi:hypothetical protein